MGLFKLTLAGVIATTALSGTAQAVPATSDADGSVLVLVPLQLTRLSHLEFGSVIQSAISGVVMIRASDGARTFAGGVTGVASDAGANARFAGAGSPNQQVIVTVDPPATLDSAAGDKVTVLGLTLDGPALRTVDATSRAFYVGVGGTLLINANQPDGDYQADFVVTANYQ